MRQLREGALLSASKLLCGVLKIKVIALALGVQGVGLLSLAMQFQGTALTFISLSLAVVIINQGRTFMEQGDPRRSGQVLGTGIAIMSASAGVFVALAFMLNWGFQLGGRIGIDSFVLVAVAISAFVMAASSVVWESTCFLIDKYPVYVRVNIISAFVDSVVIALGAWFYGVDGALYALLLTSVAQFVVYYFLVVRDEGARELLGNLRVERTLLLPMFRQCLSVQATSILVQLSPLLARGHIILVKGNVENGYLQVGTALAAYLLPFVMNGVWGHLHPYVAANGDSAESRKELSATLEKVMPMAALACVFVVVASPFLISVFYTGDFLPARRLMVFYFAAEVMFIGLSVLTAYVVAAKMYLYCFAAYAIYHVILLSCVFMFSNEFGSMSYVLGHIIGVSLLSAVSMIWGVRSGTLSIGLVKKIGLVVLVAETCILFEAFDVFLLENPVRVAWYLFPLMVVFYLKTIVNKTAVKKLA